MTIIVFRNHAIVVGLQKRNLLPRTGKSASRPVPDPPATRKMRIVIHFFHFLADYVHTGERTIASAGVTSGRLQRSSSIALLRRDLATLLLGRPTLQTTADLSHDLPLPFVAS